MSAVSMLRRAGYGFGPARPADRGTGAVPQAAADGPDSYPPAGSRLGRQLIFFAIIAYFVLIPAVAAVWRHVTPATLFVLAGVVAFITLVTWTFLLPVRPGIRGVPWVWLTVIVGLGIALFVVGGDQGGLLAVLAVAAAACGRFTATIRPAAFGAISCAAAGLVMAAQDHYSEGDLAAVLAMPPMAAFFAYTAGKRNEMVASLRQTRAELARVAVAEERLRIARDLHDLLGHTLSLITLKAELSRRVMSSDTERAGREIAELEAVARQSLSDVREAVAGYRQPDLAAELGAARQLLTAAGMTCQITAPITAPQALGLPGDMDAVLAWTIREGITNVVRHARATSVAIAVTCGRDTVVAEILDDGPSAGARYPTSSGVVGAGVAGAGVAGSGLAGLAERVRGLGGDLAAGPLQPRGFRLRVTIPMSGRQA
jgi:two-component system sensor histidine kinase DesK